MRSSEVIRVLYATSYAIPEERPGGVGDFTLGLRDALRREGFIGWIMAAKPSRVGTSRADYHLGIEVPVEASATQYNIALGFNKWRARKILCKTRPDIIEIEERWLKLKTRN